MVEPAPHESQVAGSSPAVATIQLLRDIHVTIKSLEETIQEMQVFTQQIKSKPFLLAVNWVGLPQRNPEDYWRTLDEPHTRNSA